MVICTPRWHHYLALTVFLLGTPLWGASLKMQCNKGETYMGEPLMCEFMLQAHERNLHVEIAKFPEFRGFWKQNIALRQGNLRLNPTVSNSQVFEISLATYFLTPMVGEKNPKVIPMKLMVGDPDRAEDQVHYILSQHPGFKFKPLPAHKEQISAVGNFSLSAPQSQLEFEVKKPLQIQYQLHGTGNFQEIDTLQVDWPKEIEVVSTRTTKEGSTINQIKTFEWNIIVHSDRSFTLPQVQLTYFQPSNGRYQTTVSPPIVLTPLPASKTAQPSLPMAQPLALKPWQSPARFYKALSLSPGFWQTQAVMLALLGLLLLAREMGRVLQCRRQTLKEQVGYKKKKVIGLYKKGEMTQFLGAASELASYQLALKLNKKHFAFPTDELIGEAKQTEKLKTTAQHVERLHQAHLELIYSATKKAPSHPEELLECFKKVMSA